MTMSQSLRSTHAPWMRTTVTLASGLIEECGSTSSTSRCTCSRAGQESEEMPMPIEARRCSDHLKIGKRDRTDHALNATTPAYCGCARGDGTLILQRSSFPGTRISRISNPPKRFKYRSDLRYIFRVRCRFQLDCALISSDPTIADGACQAGSKTNNERFPDRVFWRPIIVMLCPGR